MSGVVSPGEDIPGKEVYMQGLEWTVHFGQIFYDLRRLQMSGVQSPHVYTPDPLGPSLM